MYYLRWTLFKKCPPKICLTNLNLSFVRSGWVSLSYGYLRLAGIYGGRWSRSAVGYDEDDDAEDYAYDFFFNGSVVYPSGNGYRYNGYSLRCLQE